MFMTLYFDLHVNGYFISLSGVNQYESALNFPKIRLIINDKKAPQVIGIRARTLLSKLPKQHNA